MNCEDGMKKENDVAVLELSIKKLSEAFDEFIGSCVDPDGKPKAPDKKELMRAKACLPKYCANALNKK
jgi:hypothetical protein